MSVMNPCEATPTELAKPTGRLRWNFPVPNSPHKVLQQEWEVIEYRMHQPSGRRTEWLDVPDAE